MRKKISMCARHTAVFFSKLCARPTDIFLLNVIKQLNTGADICAVVSPSNWVIWFRDIGEKRCGTRRWAAGKLTVDNMARSDMIGTRKIETPLGCIAGEGLI